MRCPPSLLSRPVQRATRVACFGGVSKETRVGGDCAMRNRPPWHSVRAGRREHCNPRAKSARGLLEAVFSRPAGRTESQGGSHGKRNCPRAYRLVRDTRFEASRLCVADAGPERDHVLGVRVRRGKRGRRCRHAADDGRNRDLHARRTGAPDVQGLCVRQREGRCVRFVRCAERGGWRVSTRERGPSGPLSRARSSLHFPPCKGNGGLRRAGVTIFPMHLEVLP